MQRAKRGWKRLPATIRKPIITFIGFIVVIIGVALLALPGPGWATIFLGFAILATEFSFAEAVRDWFIALLKRLISYGLHILREPWRFP